MRQKYGKGNTLKAIPFTSIFYETAKPQFWVSDQYYDPHTSVTSGQLLYKANEDKWECLSLDLHPDRLYCRNDDNNIHVQLQACFLKKFTHYDPSMPNHRHGLRLQFGQQLGHFLADSAETFKKWFSLLRRYTILDKFNRKYKVATKLRFVDPIFGQCCYSCVRLQDAGYYVVRILDKSSLTMAQCTSLFREVSNLRRLGHTQIVYFIELFEDETHLYQIFEYFIGSDLRSYLKESQIYQMAENSSIGLDEKLLSDTVYGLLQAVNHMHSKGVFHRDLKLDNLQIPDKKRLPFIMISNFCYSEQWHSDAQIFKKCGTPGFVAPEIFKTKNYTPKVDLFSLGVVFFVLVYGKLPFEGKDQEEILKHNEKCEIDFRQEKRLCKKISSSGINLMQMLLQKDPIKRPNSTQALAHQWFIKMDSKRTQKNNTLRPDRGRSLSTIVENSIDVTQSFYQGTTSKMATRQYDEDRVEKEFTDVNLHDRMNWYNKISYAPSKNRR